MKYGIVTQKVFERKDDSVVKIAAAVVPAQFFKTGEGIFVDSDFAERITSKTDAVETGTEYKLTAGDLLMAANDATIELALPENHIFSETDVCSIIADLITKQSEGKEGVLKNDGSLNLFYTPTFVVGVRWDSFRRGWLVGVWGRGDGAWREDERVFSPAVS